MRYFFWIFLIILLTLRLFFHFTEKPHIPEGEKVRVTDKVISQPIRYDYSQSIRLAGFRIYLPLYPEISYGDKVVIEGIVEGDSLKNARLIMFKDDSNLLLVFRKNLLAFYKKAIPEPHSSLIAGVALGSKSALPPAFWEALKKTGTIHVVVASGMNVTLVAKFLIGFFVLLLPRRRAIFLALTGIWGYSLMAGFEAPIVRAAIMGSIAFSAQEVGRLYDAWRALILTVVMMLFIKPDWISDLGFALSFVATVSLMLFEKKISRLILFLPSFLREGFSTSLAAQIGVAPILLVTFGQFNLLSPLINAVTIWTVPYITIIGMIGGLFGLIFEPLGKLILFISYPLTSWFIGVVNAFG